MIGPYRLVEVNWVSKDYITIILDTTLFVVIMIMR